MSEEVCAACGGTLRLEEKDTSSGRDMREYVCVKCGKPVIEDNGVALWQLLSDARESAAPTPSAPPKKRWWMFWKRE